VHALSYSTWYLPPPASSDKLPRLLVHPTSALSCCHCGGSDDIFLRGDSYYNAPDFTVSGSVFLGAYYRPGMAYCDRDLALIAFKD